MPHREDEDLPPPSLFELITEDLNQPLVLPLSVVRLLIEEMDRDGGRNSVNESRVTGRGFALVPTQALSDVLELALCHRVVVGTIIVGKYQHLASVVVVSAWIDTRNLVAKARIKRFLNFVLG